jgi:hypothetical protein
MSGGPGPSVSKLRSMAGGDQRLCRLLRGKAAPFRGPAALTNFLCAEREA